VRQREGTAKRYAKALLALAKANGGGEREVEELSKFSELVSGQPELRSSLTLPWVKASDKQALATSVAERLNLSKLVRDLLGLVSFRGRIEYLPEIIRVYRQLLDAEGGRVRAVVKSTVALNDAERKTLADGLSRALGKHVLLEERVEKDLLGGFIVEIGSMVLDASLNAQLAQMRERLVKGETGS
jgi:F-type H+-transporting ATPase subunit delta